MDLCGARTCRWAIDPIAYPNLPESSTTNAGTTHIYMNQIDQSPSAVVNRVRSG
ncbi:MAG: hypothetical protein JGK24_29040 [Microcoleus sp. PH2017_29_MFU_D_A]|uniref:hypothetical protein n=1 Tax=unclassified Microcoleus TaxID=2642155 RepID=UPI001D27EA9E|nr:MULTISPECIES: hypothetical protein [unclassified Microcoleus]MCC3413740.1 hypothetical protein [Microcoleus sp. PH2017_02_FOX_O_A]MCC3429448.1 hypothetical protein [Microcoleus sp. PH2017_04_SCI_O_A]MCC3443194.1 hypothetical protein [Microcoleus sp. PH2017_03_ELD_O_A]MCC3450039.1 hypothetical protein [Microcoleus sp. PH2017_09_SFU_O_A]MCC3466902.1 hypothetical protein [Microcoleus sp. PH2017_06_SFM_O_A]MCC3505679.1 hypothetical protein [Microcoleus sp. PH2017_19_SFW_U_A]MCC3511108.1 hypot